MLAGATVLFGVLLSALGPSVESDSYEWQRTRAVLEAEGLQVDRAPDGKRIAWIRVVRDQVFVDGELFPTWLNVFHARTRERVVRRELLFADGDAYDHDRIEESMRNLRGMAIFAQVRIVAVQTEQPDAVGVLVHTRDLWSLRFETAFNLSSQINSVDLALVERNLAGFGHYGGLGFALRPDTFSISETYNVRRLLGGSLRLVERGGVIFNRERVTPEGGFGQINFGRPFYRIAQRSSFGLVAGYSARVRRQLSNGVPLSWTPSDTTDPAGLRIWNQRLFNSEASYSVRRGQRTRHTVGVVWFFNAQHFAPNAETGISPALHAAFRNDVLPPERRETGPGLRYRLFVPSFRTYTNLDTFGQSENVRLGPDVDVAVSAPLTLVGSYKEARIVSAALGWTWALGDGLLTARGSARGRYQDATWLDQRLEASIRGATPMLGFLRLVARARLALRHNDTAKTLVTLGSEDGLRGYPADHLTGYGAHLLNVNVELRTRALSWRGVLLGAVAFYDAGAVFTSIPQAQLRHGVGVGLRLLLPQLNRTPWVADAGFATQPLGFVPTVRSALVMSVD
ncbi:MAG: hypothetical protein B7733_26405 [Myxococcales bacterium FL481]|nr:MAG: hypothetical protein B7733_26405 [Myxococcales bacterium FL481]